MRRDFSIGEAIAAPFRLAFGKPFSTLAWGLVMIVPSVVAIAAMAPLVVQAIETGDAGTLAGETGMEGFEDLGAYLSFQAWNGLANILGLVATLLVTTAVIRAVLAGRRGDGGAFLRFGRDEFHVAVIGLAIIVGIVALWLVIGGVAVGLGLAAGIGGGGMAWAGWLAGGLGLLLAVVTLVLWGRLSLLAPAAVITRTLAFEAGWRAGRGKTGKLFLLIICLFAVTILIGLVFILLVLIAAVALGAGMGQWPDDAVIEAWMLAQLENPGLLIGVSLAALPPLAWLTGFSQALWTAPFASAARELLPPPETVGADAPGEAG
jgi:hypothetical protein